MATDVQARMAPLIKEATDAFLKDPSYAFEVAKQGSLISARREKKTSAATPVRKPRRDV